MAESNSSTNAVEEPKVTLEGLKAIYGVHACYGWPAGKPGRLVPAVIADSDKGKIKKGTPLTGLVGWKATIHFSLGGLLPEGADFVLSDRRRAVLLPLHMLTPHATTIHTDDVVIVGEFAVPNGAIVISPGDASDEAWLRGGKYTHIKLNPNDRLDTVIDKILQEKQAKAEIRVNWKLHAQSGTHDLVAFVGDNNKDDWVVDDVFFKPLLDTLDSKTTRWAAFAHSELGFINANKQFLVFSKAHDDLKRSYRDSCAEIKELVQSVGNDLAAKIPKFAPYWKDLQERAKQVLKSKMSPDVVTSLMFTETGNYDDVANHMATWLVKARYLTKKTISAVTFPTFKGLTALEAKNYLLEVGMMHEGDE